MWERGVEDEAVSRQTKLKVFEPLFVLISLSRTNLTFLKDIYTNTVANRWNLINLFFRF